MMFAWLVEHVFVYQSLLEKNRVCLLIVFLFFLPLCFLLSLATGRDRGQAAAKRDRAKLHTASLRYEPGEVASESNSKGVE
jgi:hypothetical protein